MRKLFLALLLVPALMMGETRTEKISGKVTSLTVMNGVDVVYVPGKSSTTVTLKGEPNDVWRIKVEKMGSRLYIRTQSDARNIGKVEITLEAPAVGDIDVSSGANLTVDAPYSAKNLTLHLTSSADVSFKTVNCTNFDAVMTSDAELSIKSLTAAKSELTTTSAAEVSVETMNSVSSKVYATSASEATIRSLSGKSLDIAATSGSEISVSGMAVGSTEVLGTSSASIKLSGKSSKTTINASSGAEINKSGLTSGDISVNLSSGATIK